MAENPNRVSYLSNGSASGRDCRAAGRISLRRLRSHPRTNDRACCNSVSVGLWSEWQEVDVCWVACCDRRPAGGTRAIGGGLLAVAGRKLRPVQFVPICRFVVRGRKLLAMRAVRSSAGTHPRRRLQPAVLPGPRRGGCRRGCAAVWRHRIIEGGDAWERSSPLRP
jgi:hypothetical protein